MASRLESGKHRDWKILSGITLFAIALFVITITLPQYSISFSIMGTLVMAGVALMAIQQRDEQLKSDKRERKLITIIEWANNIVQCEMGDPLPLPPEKRVEEIFKYYERTIKINLMMSYEKLMLMGTRIVLTARRLDKQSGSELEGLALQTYGKLSEHVGLDSKFVGGEVSSSEYKKSWIALKNSAGELSEKAEEAME